MEIVKTKLVKLEIQEINLVAKEKMIEQAVLSQSRPKWCDGFLLMFTGYTNNDRMIEDQINGIYRWQGLDFAIMPKYERYLKDQDNNQTICFDVSHSEFYDAITDYLKKLIHKVS